MKIPDIFESMSPFYEVIVRYTAEDGKEWQLPIQIGRLLGDSRFTVEAINDDT